MRSFLTYIRFGIFCVLSTLGISVWAQTDSLSDRNDSTIVDVAKLRFQKTLYHEIFYAVSSDGSISDRDIPTLPYQLLAEKPNVSTVPPSYVEKDVYLRLTIFNSADTLHPVYFMPGRFCKNVTMFQASPGNVTQTLRVIPDETLRTEEYGGYRLLKIPPKDTVVFFTRFNFLRTNVNSFFAKAY